MADAQQQSSVGTHLSELYNDIQRFQEERDEADRNLNKAKQTFAKYLKQAGIDKLLNSGDQSKVFGESGGEKKERVKRGPNKSQEERDEEKQQYVRNKEIYVSTYPNGINQNTGLPIRFKGRDKRNEGIDAQMADDERDYAYKQNSPKEEAKPTAQKPAKKK